MMNRKLISPGPTGTQWAAVSILLGIMAWTAIGHGATASHWSHTTDADFKAGAFDNVVATNLGDLKLSRRIKVLLEQDPQVSSVYSMARTGDGTVYAATGPRGIVLRIQDGLVERALTLGQTTNLLSILAMDDGTLLLGTGGDRGRVLKVDPKQPKAKPVEIFSSPDVQYIWDMRRAPDGMLYLATGPHGKLYEVNPEGKSRVLLDSDEHNLLGLIFDGGDMLYFGTDPNGLVYRVNRHSGESFILYDAPESEVSALALDGRGNLYAGTSEAIEGANFDTATGGVSGRPEGKTTGMSIPAEPPKNPAPPPIPSPNPGEPKPIPKSPAQGLLLDRGWDSLRVQSAMMGLVEVGDDSGSLTPPGTAPKPALAGGALSPPPGSRAGAAQVKPEGNAIYRIDPEGFVSEVFRQPVMILSILEQEGRLLVGTGSDGLIYQVDPGAEETIVLAKAQGRQVTAMLGAPDRRVVLGLANAGSIAELGAGFAPTGTYVSPVLDAVQISRFGKARLHGRLPDGASLSFATRSGNVQDPSGQGWSAWTHDQPANEFLAIDAKPARFLQYRLTFTTTKTDQSPIVDEVDVAYQSPNLPPVVKSLKVAAAAPPAAAEATPAPGTVADHSHMTVTWEASDPNADPLRYSLSLRDSERSPWVLLKEGIKETTFDWDTRQTADGRYQLRLLASDALANPPGAGRDNSRVSDPVVVDNTPPAIGDLELTRRGDVLTATFRAVDQTGTVAALDYSMDSTEVWQAALPLDSICDSPEEPVRLEVSKLTPGPHRLTLRATDSRGNQGYVNVLAPAEVPAGEKAPGGD